MLEEILLLNWECCILYQVSHKNQSSDSDEFLKRLEVHMQGYISFSRVFQ